MGPRPSGGAPSVQEIVGAMGTDAVGGVPIGGFTGAGIVVAPFTQALSVLAL